MHFELLITGRIPTGKGNKNLTHRTEIRKQVHEQLRRLWALQPLIDRPEMLEDTTYATCLVKRHDKEFVVLARQAIRTACKLQVVFYEPEGSLEVASQVADTDNRLAGLLDLLTIPVGADAAQFLGERTFSLLEDDKLVWALSIERRRLFRTVEGAEMFTRIAVQLIPTQPSLDNIALIDIPAH